MRNEIVNEAMSWLRTPYHHRSNLKGEGVDCLLLLVEVYVAVGLIERPSVPDYQMDIMMHRNDETYMAGILDYADEVERPQPGDVALWKFGRSYSHGAIVVDWPTIIHAHRLEGGVVLARGDGGELADRDVKFFSIRGL